MLHNLPFRSVRLLQLVLLAVLLAGPLAVGKEGQAAPAKQEVAPFCRVRVDASGPYLRPATPPTEEGEVTEPAPAPVSEGSAEDPAAALTQTVESVWPSADRMLPPQSINCALNPGSAGEAPAGVTAAALRMPGVVVVGLRRAPEASPNGEQVAAAPVRYEVRLPRGLWRVDAAMILETVEGVGEPRRWRMQSVLHPQVGLCSKTLALAPGQTLILRFSETVAAARSAQIACREFLNEGGSTYSGASIRTTLRQVGAIIDSLPAFIARSDRATITKKVHRALLSAAQAQAMLQNGRGASLFEQETAMLKLVANLSEISCAACGLVPALSVVREEADGAAVVRVTLSNAGARPVPIVALGVTAEAEDSQGQASVPTSQNVFRAVPPGRSVAATFKVADARTARATVQFIIGMGAASVSARPVP